MLLTPQKSYERKLKEMILSLRLEHGAVEGRHPAPLPEPHLPRQRRVRRRRGGARVLRQGASRTSPSPRRRCSPACRRRRAATRRTATGRRPRRASATCSTACTRSASSTARRATPRSSSRSSLASRKGSFQAAPYFVEHVRRLLEETLRPHRASTSSACACTPPLDLRLQDRGGGRRCGGGIDASGRRSYGGYPRRLPQHGARGARDLPAHCRCWRSKAWTRRDPAFSYEAPGHRRARRQRPRAGRTVHRRSWRFRSTRTATEAARSASCSSTTWSACVPSTPTARCASSTIRARLIEGALIAIEPHDRLRQGDGRRLRLRPQPFQPRHPGARASPARRSSRSSTPPRFDRNFTPASVIVDEPISFNDNGRIWAPQNFEKKFFGPTSLREALTSIAQRRHREARRTHRAQAT